MALDAASVERFAAALSRRLGLRDDAIDRPQAGELLARRAGAGGAERYLDRLEAGVADGEWPALAAALSVGETAFFRHRDHFRAFAEVALPDLLRVGRSPLRILSAGCASGEEPYSIAMVLEAAAPGREAVVTGIDASGAQLARARAARYTRWSMRETSDEERARWFAIDGDFFSLRPAWTATVAFAERNLLDDDADFWSEGAFDVVFCRNVLIYFHDAAIREVIARFARALRPGGWLFLGPSESLRGMADGFALRQSHDCFYYRRVDGSTGTASERLPADWPQEIARSARRLADLPLASPTAATAARPSIDEVIALLRADRAADAARLLAPLGAGDEPRLLLARAAVLAAAGDLDAAERDCAPLLAQAETASGARFVLALCRAHRGDDAGSLALALEAAETDRRGFALARLHAGMTAARRGDRDRARRELRRACELIGREDDLRLALFGGGFSRGDLAAMCRARLGALEREP